MTGFWSDRELQDLPYQHGFLLASLIDHRLRERSNGRNDMDDVFERMKQLAEATRPRGDADTTRGLLAGSAFVAAARELGVDPTPEIAANILNGAAFALPADLLGAGATIETLEAPEFTRGFDAMATHVAGGVVAGCVLDGPGYAAGMRDGMKIVKREGGGVGATGKADRGR